MFVLDHKSRQPLYDKIYQQIKEQILSGELAPNTKLPSIKNLAAELSVSRNTVEAAYQQLYGEGYIDSKARSGYYVSLIDSEFLPQIYGQRMATPPKPLEEINNYIFDFHPARLSVKSFPITLWRTLYNDCLKVEAEKLACYNDQQGDLALRYQIQKYLARSRGVSCSPEQIIICSGLQDSLSILSPILGENHVHIGIEEPGHFIPKVVFKNNSFSLVPIPVTSDGLNVEYLHDTQSTVVYVTPSHQFPLGHVMPVANRLQLIDWAEQVGGVIIEDDYDSELRYYGKPIAALQGLHPQGKIVYVGTFSKVLSPVLRISYMVLPYPLLTIYHQLFNNYATNVSLLEQKTLQKFMEQGHWERHLRRMRTVYSKKHDAILLSIQRYFGEKVKIIGQGAGLHIVLEILDTFLTEEELIKRAQEKSIYLMPVSGTYLQPSSRKPQIMFGFGNMSSEEMDRGLELLYQAWYL